MKQRQSCDWRAALVCAFVAGAAVPAAADCSVYPFSVAQPVVERFLFRPDTLLGDYRDGGPSMTSRVQLIAASSRAALQPLMKQVSASNARQRQAIALGLANAVKMCGAKNRDDARAIEQAARTIGDAAFQRDFRANSGGATADVQSRERAALDPRAATVPFEPARAPLFDPSDPRLILPMAPIRPIGPVGPATR